MISDGEMGERKPVCCIVLFCALLNQDILICRTWPLGASVLGYFWLPCAVFKFPCVYCGFLQKSELLKCFKLYSHKRVVRKELQSLYPPNFSL